MRNKISIQNKLEKIELLSKSLNFYIGRMERKEAYKVLDDINYIISDIITFLNTETQE